jgi:hypothetical protein
MSDTRRNAGPGDYEDDEEEEEQTPTTGKVKMNVPANDRKIEDRLEDDEFDDDEEEYDDEEEEDEAVLSDANGDAGENESPRKAEESDKKVTSGPEIEWMVLPMYPHHFYSDVVKSVVLPRSVCVIAFKTVNVSKSNASVDCFTFFGLGRRKTCNAIVPYKDLLFLMTYEHILLLDVTTGNIERVIRLLDVKSPIRYVLSPPAIQLHVHDQPDLQVIFEENVSLHEKDRIAGTVDDLSERIQVLNDRCIHDVKSETESQASANDEFFLDVEEFPTVANFPPAVFEKSEGYQGTRATLLTVLNNEYLDLEDEAANAADPLGSSFTSANGGAPITKELDVKRRETLAIKLADLLSKIDHDSLQLQQTLEANERSRKTVAFLNGLVATLRTRLFEVQRESAGVPAIPSKMQRSIDLRAFQKSKVAQEVSDEGEQHKINEEAEEAMTGITQLDEEDATASLVRARTEHEMAVLQDKMGFVQNQLVQVQEHAARAWLRTSVADATISALTTTLVGLECIAASSVREESGTVQKREQLEQEERALTLELSALSEVERRTVGSRRRENHDDPFIATVKKAARIEHLNAEKHQAEQEALEKSLRTARLNHEGDIAMLQASHRAEIAAIQARAKVAFRAQHADARAKAANASSSVTTSSVNEATNFVSRRIGEQISRQRMLRSSLMEKSRHLPLENEALMETNEALKDLMDDMHEEYGRALEAVDLLRLQLQDAQLHLDESCRERAELLEAKKRKLNLSTQYVVQQKDREIAAARRLLKDLQNSVESVARAYGHLSGGASALRQSEVSATAFSPTRRF